MKMSVAKGAALALLFSAVGHARAVHAQEAQPRLVVLIAVDQMRADLLDRYADIYSGGLRRFLDEGYRFSVASHAHAHT